MGICLSNTSGRAGLGNELIVWGKAYLAAQALGGMCVPPPWGLNPRGYGKYFRSSRLDILRNQALLRLIPHFAFTAESYQAIGTADYFDAVKIWADSCGLTRRSVWLCAAEGMWGGYLAIRRAREYLRKQLLSTRWTLENLTEYSGKIDPDCLQVALHIRRGDFLSPQATDSYRNKFNIAIPKEWYANIARSIRYSLGSKNVQFTVISDGEPSELTLFEEDFGAITTRSQKNRDVSDLLILASADVLVCSISSYSMFAAFLSKGLYLWYEPHMSGVNHGFYSLWGAQDDQKTFSSPTQRSVRLTKNDQSASPRGIPVKASGELNDRTLAEVSAKWYPGFCDLIQFGIVRYGD
jgi:hypothetical protein